ncbi:MAG TPA: polyprenyl synthetase family protein [bacterium]|nr:polyprenyl synthetase family protein [bacterium]
MEIFVMMKLVDQLKSEITEEARKKIQDYGKGISGYGNIIGEDSLLRLFEFISRGKFIRGILAVSSYRALGGNDKEKMLSVAVAIELLHAGFLMHDDVMDGDILRRGEPSVHVSYRDLFADEGLLNPEKNGESFAICLGNIAYFIAFDLIAGSGFDTATAIRLIRIFNREAVITGLGQMNDIFTGALKDFPDERSILDTYRMKTARYTFSLPLIMGSVCAGLDDELIEKIVEPAEAIGLVFQMRDDELNILEDPQGTGKSAGSDITEGKKTLIISMLLKNIEGDDKRKMEMIFSKKELTLNELEYIRKALADSGTVEEHRKMISQISLSAKETIESLDINEEYKNILRYILKISVERKF